MNTLKARKLSFSDMTGRATLVHTLSKSDLANGFEAASKQANPPEGITPLVSILTPSRRPHQFAGLLESLRTTLADYRNVEVLAKIDDDDPVMLDTYREIAHNSPVTCKLVVGPRLGGVFTLWIGMEEALAQIDKDTYFVIALTDEGRFLTSGWDSFLRSYVGFFPDHLFRLRLSNVTKFVQYANYLTCSTIPESFPIFTRRWLELTEGFTHLSYGFDAYQQAIATRLAIDGTLNRDIWNSRGMYRDVPIAGIELGGIDFGKDISKVETITRMIVGTREWLRLVSYHEQDHISYLATRLRLYIVCKARFKDGFRLQQNARLKMVSALDQSGKVLAAESYRISRLHSYFFYCKVMISLLPSRLKYFYHESVLAGRLPRIFGADRLNPPEPTRSEAIEIIQSEAPAKYLSSHKFRKKNSRIVTLSSNPVLWSIGFIRMFPSLDFPYRPDLFRYRQALRLSSFLQATYLLKRIRRYLGAPLKRRYPSVFLDILLYPFDRLLWTPPALLGRSSLKNPMSLFARLKRLGYPIPSEGQISQEIIKIEKLKIERYRKIEF